MEVRKCCKTCRFFVSGECTELSMLLMGDTVAHVYENADVSSFIERHNIMGRIAAHILSRSAKYMWSPAAQQSLKEELEKDPELLSIVTDVADATLEAMSAAEVRVSCDSYFMPLIPENFYCSKYD